MSCRSNPGNSAVTSYARATSGLADAQTLSLFHRLVREGTAEGYNAPPTTEQLTRWRDQMIAIVNQDESLSVAQRQSIINRLQRIGATNSGDSPGSGQGQQVQPDGPTFYAWVEMTRRAHESSRAYIFTLNRLGVAASWDNGAGAATLAERIAQLQAEFEADPNHNHYRPASPTFIQDLRNTLSRLGGSTNGELDYPLEAIPQDRASLYILENLARPDRQLPAVPAPSTANIAAVHPDRVVLETIPLFSSDLAAEDTTNLAMPQIETAAAAAAQESVEATPPPSTSDISEVLNQTTSADNSQPTFNSTATPRSGREVQAIVEPTAPNFISLQTPVATQVYSQIFLPQPFSNRTEGRNNNNNNNNNSGEIADQTRILNTRSPGSDYEYQPLDRPLRTDRGEVAAFNSLRSRWQQAHEATITSIDDDDDDDDINSNFLSGLTPTEADQLYDYTRRRLHTQANRLSEAVQQFQYYQQRTPTSRNSQTTTSNSSNATMPTPPTQVNELINQLNEYQKRRLEFNQMSKDRHSSGYSFIANPDPDYLGYGKQADQVLTGWLTDTRPNALLASGRGLVSLPSSAASSSDRAGARSEAAAAAAIEEMSYTLPDYAQTTAGYYDPDRAEPLYIRVRPGTGAALRENIIRSGLPIVVLDNDGSNRLPGANGVNPNALNSSAHSTALGQYASPPPGAIVLNWGDPKWNSNETSPGRPQTIGGTGDNANGSINGSSGAGAGDGSHQYAVINSTAAINLTRDKVNSIERLGDLAPASTTNPALAVSSFGQAFVAKQRYGQAGAGKTILQNLPPPLPSPLPTVSNAATSAASSSGSDVDPRPLGNLPATAVVGYDLFQEYLPDREEYRTLVLGGEVIALYRKIPQVGSNTPGGDNPTTANDNVSDGSSSSSSNTSRDTGEQVRLRPERGFEYVNQTTITSRQLQASQMAMERLELDFGGVDLVYDRATDRYLVLEVNSAPGLGQESLQRLYGAVQSQLQRNPPPPPPPTQPPSSSSSPSSLSSSEILTAAAVGRREEA